VKNPSESRIAILGAARNIEKTIGTFYETLLSAFSQFKRVTFYLVESNSTDNSKDKLLKLSENVSNLNFESVVSELNLEFGNRTQRIAEARNIALEFARQNFINYEYIAVADLDEINFDLTEKAVLSCWDHSEWDMLSANQSEFYYDIWALRAAGWSERDCWREYDELKVQIGNKKAFEIAINKKRRRIKPNSELIRVNSSFGGLAIYRTEAYFEGSYSGVDKKGEAVCEHVEFNSKLISHDRKLFINPRLINQKRCIQIIQKSKALITNAYSKDLSPFK
jgi:Cryptococcal mannosyltransferase 1